MIQSEIILKRKILEAIKKEMVRQDLSQNGLGELCGVSRIHVNKILNEAQSVSFKKLIEMANALGLKVDVKITKGHV